MCKITIYLRPSPEITEHIISHDLRDIDEQDLESNILTLIDQYSYATIALNQETYCLPFRYYRKIGWIKELVIYQNEIWEQEGYEFKAYTVDNNGRYDNGVPRNELLDYWQDKLAGE